MGQRQKILAPVADRGGKGFLKPRRDIGVATLGKAAGAVPGDDRQDARHDRRVDPGRRAGVAEPQEGFGLEEELGDGAAGARVDLALQPVHIGLLVGGLGVRLGISADGDVELAGGGQRLDQFHRIGETVGMRHEAVGALRRIAAQRHDVGHTGLGIGIRDLKRFGPAGIDAGQVGGDAQPVVLADGRHCLMRQFAGGAARAVGDRDIVWFQRLKRLHGVPEPERGVERTGREEFEGNAGRGHDGVLCCWPLVSRR